MEVDLVEDVLSCNRSQLNLSLVLHSAGGELAGILGGVGIPNHDHLLLLIDPMCVCVCVLLDLRLWGVSC